MTQPTATPNNSKSTLLPMLRFPEFRDAPAWQEKTLGSLGRFTRGLTYSADDVTSQGLPVLRSTNIQEGTLILDRDLVFVGKECSDALRLQKGDIAICMSNGSKALVGKSAEYAGDYPGDITVGAFCSFFRPSLPFAKLAFQTNDYARYVGVLIAGGNINNLNNTVLEEFNFPIPPSETEQQKIAECLSTLDELIGAEGQKLDALKAHKKGLIQQLFPREGETLPRLRFPEFHSAPEWATKIGGDLFENRKEDGEAGLPIYSVTINDGMVPRASFDRDFYDIEDPAGNKKVYKGDIAYNMMRMWQGAQGVAPEDCMVSPAYVVLEPKKGVCTDFFAYLFKLPHILRLLTATSRGLTKDRLRLYFDDFAKMRLCVPKFEEQHRIATCLSSLDELISAQSDLLSALRTHKQGLLQQLFPDLSQSET
jgi:type I restriction enzyme S subunit